jgi:hypothetical protein
MLKVKPSRWARALRFPLAKRALGPVGYAAQNAAHAKTAAQSRASDVRSQRRFRAVAAIASLLVLLPSSQALAEDDSPLGFAIAGAMFAAVAAGDAPLFFLRESDAPLDLSMHAGVSGELNQFALAAAGTGQFSVDGPFGWSTNARFDLPLDPDLVGFQGKLRVDVVGSAALWESPADGASIEALLGATTWTSLEDRNRDGETEWHGSLGPAAGARATFGTPLFSAALSALYVPLFGEPPSLQTHHLDLASTVSFCPEPDSEIPLTALLTVKREVGFADGPLYRGTVLLLGIELPLATPRRRSR